jgi:hypothetical protein
MVVRNGAAGPSGPLALTIVTHLGTQLVTTPSPPGDREADLATEELRLAAFGIAEHGLDGRCRL